MLTSRVFKYLTFLLPLFFENYIIGIVFYYGHIDTGTTWKILSVVEVPLTVLNKLVCTALSVQPYNYINP